MSKHLTRVLKRNNSSVPVVGNYYMTAQAQTIYRRMLGTTPHSVLLRCEPGNRYDVNAIAVFNDDGKVQLGHVDRKNAAELTTIICEALKMYDFDAKDRDKVQIWGTTSKVGDRVYVTIDSCETNLTKATRRK